MSSVDERLRGTGVLPVFVRIKPAAGLHWLERIFSFGISFGCLTLFYISAKLVPDGRGIGTHEQLGLPACGFVQIFGMPCPSCGFTTSFALFVRFRWWESFWNQPAGFAIALAAVMVAWVGLYEAVTGRPAHRLFGRYVTARGVFGAALFVLLAWAWKIALVKVMHHEI